MLDSALCWIIPMVSWWRYLVVEFVVLNGLNQILRYFIIKAYELCRKTSVRESFVAGLIGLDNVTRFSGFHCFEVDVTGIFI